MWVSRRQRQMRSQFLARLREREHRLAVATEQLRSLEAALDNRASVVVVAGGIVIAANVAIPSSLGFDLGVLSVICAALSMAAAVLSLAMATPSTRRELEPFRYIEPGADTTLAAEVDFRADGLKKVSAVATKRHIALTWSYALFLVSALILAVSVLIRQLAVF